MRRVVVTGLGAITPLGVGIKQTWQRLIAGHSGLVSTIPLSTATHDYASIPAQVAGLVPVGRAAEHTWEPLSWVSKNEMHRMSKFTQYAMAASKMALEDAGWAPEPDSERAEMTGVCLGSGIGNLEEIVNTTLDLHQGGYRRVNPLFVPRILTNMAAGHISMAHGFLGPNHAVTTACTTGAHSLGDAARFIVHGDSDVMVAGGAESCIHPLTFAGFARARSLATAYNAMPEKASRPFDKDRCGFVIGEGAGIAVLEELEHARARGAHIYAEIVGYGNSADAYHMTAPREDGAGALLAMRRALKDARVKPREVGYVNAHATSTVIGDAAENAAIQRLMTGEDGWEKKADVTVSSTKGAMGHLLGAAGAIEAIFAILAVKENIVPPTLNLHDPSPGFELNYVPLHAQEKEVKVAISNSFGFGGTNSTLVFAKEGYMD